MSIVDVIAVAVAGTDLSAAEMQSAMREILAGKATEAQIAALAVALRMKGETATEIAAAAGVMREVATRVVVDGAGPLLDTCGTGGDGAHTFNISTAAAIVVSACGVRVAKHGSRAVSSSVGSSDVLSALGVNVDLTPDAVVACVQECGIGFLFAPHHHSALRHAAPVRQQLRMRTFFNQLGPLSNPAGATHQLVGVYDPALTEHFAHALGQLGLRYAWAVHGSGGLDEVSPAGETRVSVWDGSAVATRSVQPRDFGESPVAIAQLRGGDSTTNAAIIRTVLGGGGGAPRVAVVINAAAALCVARESTDTQSAADEVRRAIDDGRALATLQRWAATTQRLAESST